MLGQRCHAIRGIHGHQGLITVHTQGTIEAEIDNLGRHLMQYTGIPVCKCTCSPMKSKFIRRWKSGMEIAR